MKKVLGVVCLLAATAANAVDSDAWLEITHSDSHTYYMRVGTFRNAGGSSSILIEDISKPGDRVWHNRVSVKNKDCDNGYGTATYFYLDGKVEFRKEFVVDGRSMVDVTGGLVCRLRALVSKKK